MEDMKTVSEVLSYKPSFSRSSYHFGFENALWFSLCYIIVFNYFSNVQQWELCRDIDQSTSYDKHLLQYYCITVRAALDIRIVKCLSEEVQLVIPLDDRELGKVIIRQLNKGFNEKIKCTTIPADTVSRSCRCRGGCLQ